MDIDCFRVAMPCEKSALSLTEHFARQGANTHLNTSNNEVLLVAGRGVTEDSVYSATEQFARSAPATVGLYAPGNVEIDTVEIGANRLHSQHFGFSVG